MALDQGAAGAITSAIGAGILGTAVGLPMSPADFTWFTAFALWGIAAKHASNAASERNQARLLQKPRPEWPTMDWLALTYDSLTAPFLGITGWSLSYYVVLWAWNIPLDKSVLLPAAMVSGFIGAEWIRFGWQQVRGIVSGKTGVPQ